MDCSYSSSWESRDYRLDSRVRLKIRSEQSTQGVHNTLHERLIWSIKSCGVV